jgi:hypothetical protein
MGLALHLSTGAPVDQALVAAWHQTAEGQRFMSLSSEWWAEADIAGGADEVQARAAAERTAAAYKGG